MKIMQFNLYDLYDFAVESTFEIIPVFGITGFKGYRCTNPSIEVHDIERLVNLYKDYQAGPTHHYKANDAGHMTLVSIDTPYTGTIVPIHGINRHIRIAGAE